MASALTLETMSPGLLQVVERAQREPAGRFHALAHLIDPPACRCGGRSGWRHEGAVWASPGGQPSGPACTVEGAAVAPPADPTGAHPKGPGQDPADWDVGVRGQSGPRRCARGTRSHLRAGLFRLLVWVSAWAQCPRRRAHPGADRAPGRGAVELRGRHRILLGSYILMPPSSTHATE
jgi:hypothetical protein